MNVKSIRKFRKTVVFILVLMMVFSEISFNSGEFIIHSLPTYAAQIPSLNINAGFEQDFNYWRKTISSAAITIDTTQAYEQSKSLKIAVQASDKRACIDQLNVPVNAGSTYRLSAQYKLQDWTGEATLQIYWYTGENQSGYISYQATKLPTGTNDWIEFGEELVAPAGAKYAMIRINAMSGTGTLWMDQVELKKIAQVSELAYIALLTDKTFLQEGDTVALNVYGVMGDGSNADLSSAEINFISDAPEIISVSGNTATALRAGMANIIARVVLDEQIETVSVLFEVEGSTGIVTYDFKAGIDATIETQGWQIKEDNIAYDYNNTGKGYRPQAYGIQVFTSSIDEYITFAFEVPNDGYYTVKFTGAGAGGGAIADLFVDGSYVGQYDFYSAAYIPAKPQLSLKTLELTRGLHDFTLRPVNRSTGSWGYNMYPGELEIVKQQSLPTLVDLQVNCSEQDLAIGQTGAFEVKGIMSDEYVDSLIGDDAIKHISVSDSSIIELTESGSIRALKAGTANLEISVTLNGTTIQKVIPITVNDKVLDQVELTLAKSELPVGLTTQVAISAKLNDGSVFDLNDAVVVYESTNQLVATINDGVITAVSEGSTTIKAHVTLADTTITGESTFKVVPRQLESIEVSTDKTELFVGRQAQLTVTGTMNDNNDADMTKAVITYESSDTSILAIDEKGLATALKPGTATITVSVTIDGITKTDNTIVIIIVSTENIQNSKTKQSYYTPEKIAAARENVKIYTWAKAIKDAAVEEANQYVNQAEVLWNMVTPQSIPRSFTVNTAYKCPSCGTDLRAKYGNYPWIANPITDPWKIKCPECGIKLPSNDFGAYYKSGLDEHGIFDPLKADKSLLVNTLYPEKGAGWGVDDGYGHIDESGVKHTFVAYYNHWNVWYGGTIEKALNALRDAYLYTGDLKYARTGTILLDRIADVYPDMNLKPYQASDGYLNSHGGTGIGRIVGSIWETGLVQSFAKAYDAFFPAIEDAQIISFLSEKSRLYDLDNPKNTGNLIKKNIEDGILREIYSGFKNIEIRGNFGMHQAALALAAVVLDSDPETREWLDFTFQAGSISYSNKENTGGNIFPTLINQVDRDGHGNEAAPGYNRLWMEQLKQVADILDGYEGYGGADLYRNPKFMKMFSAMYPLMLCERYMAQIGDSGGTGNTGLFIEMDDCIRGFEKFKDPVLAQLAYFLNNNSINGLHSDIFTADPENIQTQIKAIIDEQGKLNLSSDNLAGFGFGVLRDGQNLKQYFGIQLPFDEMSITDSSIYTKYFASSKTIQLEAQEIGDHISFEFNVENADEYEVNLKPFKAGSYGMYDVSIDGYKVATVDFYGGGGANAPLETLTTLNLAQGEHIITFRGIGKNDNAVGYKMGIIAVILLDQEAAAIKNDVNKIDSQRDFWIYYGRNTGHGHRDTLNLGVHAYGLDIAPELGYPEETGDQPHRLQWVSNTVSHNTVVVDDSKQKASYGGFPYHFDDTNMVKVIDIDAPNVYEQTDMYRRTLTMIKVNDEISYGIDFFRIQGGSDHYYSFHGAEATVNSEGLNLIKQETGTYAGPDIAFEERYDSVDSWGYMGSEFHYLINVEKDKDPGNVFSVDWDIIDSRQVLPQEMDIHLRLTMLTNVDDVALVDGQPPKKPGNPNWLKYMIAHRSGEDLNSLFTSVIEPYKDERYIQDIQSVPVTLNGKAASEDVKAVKVVLKNGRTDYIVNTLDTANVYTVDNKFQFKGFLGVYSEENGIPVYSYIHDGTLIANIEQSQARITGIIEDFTYELLIHNQIVIRSDVNIAPEQLVGRYIYIENDGQRNAAYRIEGANITTEGNIILDIGGTTLIHEYVDVNDFTKGYVYNIAKGSNFVIPLSYEFKQQTGDKDETDEDDSSNNLVKYPQDKVTDHGTIFIHQKNIHIDNKQAKIEVNEKSLLQAIENVRSTGQKNVEIVVPHIAEIEDINVVIPMVSLDKAIKGRIERFSITSPIADISVTLDALQDRIKEQAKELRVQLRIINKQDVEETIQEKIGNRPIYDFNIYADGEKISKLKGKKPIEVTIDYNLKQGEDIHKIIVYAITDNDGLEVIKYCTYDALKEKEIFTVPYLGAYVIKEADISFDDVSSDNWARNYIEALAARGIISGKDDKEFAPDDNITRAEFLKLIMSTFDLIQENASTTFNDVEKDAWYYQAVANAQKLGMIKGTGNNSFNPNGYVTREEMTTIAYQAIKIAGVELEKKNALKFFEDMSDISDYALESVKAMQQAGVLDGTGNNHFDAKGKATRAQGAKIIYLLYKII